MEPRFNEVAGDRPNLFVKWRVCYIEVLFHTFYCNFGRDIEIISFVISRTSLNRGSLNRGSTVQMNDWRHNCLMLNFGQFVIFSSDLPNFWHVSYKLIGKMSLYFFAGFPIICSSHVEN